MRLSFFLLLINTLTISATAYSQATKFNFDVKDASVEQIFKEMERNSNFTFLYRIGLIDNRKKVDLAVNDATVENILDQILEGTDVAYRVLENNLVILMENKANALNQILQQITITGMVTDAEGEPLPGVSVMIKGTTQGTATDANGTYTALVADGNKTLVFSYVGFVSQEFVIGNRRVINVTLSEDTQQIDEVVVVGYGTQRKVNVIGSIATVSSGDLVKAPIASTANSLAGRLAGLVSKQSSGLPGGDQATLSIRGYGAPLIIVDGVEADFNNIDANEIESISVLKDASAAIYGARAGKGVILVTTKRGKGDKPVITFNTSYSFQGVTNMMRTASSGQLSELLREAHLQSGLPEETAPYTQEQINLYYAGTNPDYPNTDWWDVVANKYAPQQQHNLSIRGGSDRIKYYGFFGYMDQQTMFKNNGGEYKRFNIRSNIDAKILENLSLQVDMATIIENRRFPWRDFEGDYSLWMDYWSTAPMYPSSLPDPSKVPYAHGGGTGGIHITSNSDLCGYRNTDNNNFTGSLALNYDFNFLKGLRARAFVNYRQDFRFYKYFDYLPETWTYNYATDTYMSMGGNLPPKLQHQDDRGRIITGQMSLNYDKAFGADHHVSGLLMYELINYSNDWIQARRFNYATKAIDYLFAGGVGDQYANGSATEMGRASYIGRFGYDFRSKYLIEATLRYDASARYSEETRWGLFPSISLGWRIAEEQFIRNNAPFLSNLKLRLSASQTGDDSVAMFQYLSGYEYGARYILGGTPSTGLRSTGIANPGLTWESMNIYNAGLDFGLWDRLLYGEFDVFYRERNGIPANRLTTLPTTFGAALPQENLNSLNNRGFELLLGHAGSSGNFKWDINANISWSREKWNHYEEAMPTDPDEIRINTKSGKWTDIEYGYKADGLFTTQDEINQLKYTYDANVDLKPGDVKYIDVNGDGIVNWRDQVEIGKGTIPHWMTGINTNLAYKGFDLSALFQGAFGYYMALNTALNFSETFYRERWSTANNDKNAIFARNGGAASNSWKSNFNYHSANYLRLKTLSVGYQLPAKWLEPAHIQSLRIYFAGTNLFTVSRLNKYNADPEALSGFMDRYYPLMQTFSFGLNISL